MNNFTENKELIQQFADTFNVSKTDIYNFLLDTAQEREAYEFIKNLESDADELSNKYHNRFIKLDTEYIRIEKMLINEYAVTVKGVAIEFYDECDYREEIELTYDNVWFLMGVENKKTTVNDIEGKIKSLLVGENEMVTLFNENFDDFRLRFYNRFFGIN
jgi:hypothetical protein